jgi:branched-chain amino acid transport system ATP-binding protein
MARPKLLLLDEPSLGLAPLVVDLVFSKLENLRESGVTVLVVEQNAARTVESADRIYVLRGGTIKFHGTNEEVKTRFDLAQAYLGT